MSCIQHYCVDEWRDWTQDCCGVRIDKSEPLTTRLHILKLATWTLHVWPMTNSKHSLSHCKYYCFRFKLLHQNRTQIWSPVRFGLEKRVCRNNTWREYCAWWLSSLSGSLPLFVHTPEEEHAPSAPKHKYKLHFPLHIFTRQKIL